MKTRAFHKYTGKNETQRSNNANERKATERRGRGKLVNNMTVDLVQLYKRCNAGFRYTQQLNPRRALTKPSKGVTNYNFDNVHGNFILYVNDIICGKNDDRYVVIDLLGQGTFGQVVNCRLLGTDENYAIKVVKNKQAYFNQGLVEVQILSKLNKLDDSGKIVKFMVSFTFRRHLCLVFEMLSINLYELIKQNNHRGLSTNLVRHFLQQILGGLHVLYKARIIHCDLKPENILLMDNNSSRVKLIDFGSACYEKETVYSYIQSRFYRSPEVILGVSYGTEIDIWSLGCIAAELFLGLPLFPGHSEFNQITRLVDMLGMPPDDLLKQGKNTHKYFRRQRRSNNPPAPDSPRKPRYRLKTTREYAKETGVPAKASKRYFAYDTMEENILNYPFKSGLSPAALEQETATRRCFIHFLRGLLHIDPRHRWTAKQALQHPFITGKSFDGTFAPTAAVPPPSAPLPHNISAFHKHKRNEQQLPPHLAGSPVDGPVAAADSKPIQSQESPYHTLIASSRHKHHQQPASAAAVLPTDDIASSAPSSFGNFLLGSPAGDSSHISDQQASPYAADPHHHQQPSFASDSPHRKQQQQQYYQQQKQLRRHRHQQQPQQQYQPYQGSYGAYESSAPYHHQNQPQQQQQYHRQRSYQQQSRHPSSSSSSFQSVDNTSRRHSYRLNRTQPAATPTKSYHQRQRQGKEQEYSGNRQRFSLDAAELGNQGYIPAMPPTVQHSPYAGSYASSTTSSSSSSTTPTASAAQFLAMPPAHSSTLGISPSSRTPYGPLVDVIKQQESSSAKQQLSPHSSSFNPNEAAKQASPSRQRIEHKAKKKQQRSWDEVFAFDMDGEAQSPQPEDEKALSKQLANSLHLSPSNSARSIRHGSTCSQLQLSGSFTDDVAVDLPSAELPPLIEQQLPPHQQHCFPHQIQPHIYHGHQPPQQPYHQQPHHQNPHQQQQPQQPQPQPSIGESPSLFANVHQFL